MATSGTSPAQERPLSTNRRLLSARPPGSAACQLGILSLPGPYPEPPDLDCPLDLGEPDDEQEFSLGDRLLNFESYGERSQELLLRQLDETIAAHDAKRSAQHRDVSAENVATAERSADKAAERAKNMEDRAGNLEQSAQKAYELTSARRCWRRVPPRRKSAPGNPTLARPK